MWAQNKTRGEDAAAAALLPSVRNALKYIFLELSIRWHVWDDPFQASKGYIIYLPSCHHNSNNYYGFKTIDP